MSNHRNKNKEGTNGQKVSIMPSMKTVTKEDLTQGYILAMNERGYVMLVLAVPDSTRLPTESAQGYVGVWGNLPTPGHQVELLRKVADSIEGSVDLTETKAGTTVQ